MGIENWSTTAASNNSSPPAGAPEGMAPSAVNDVIRQIMADVRSQLQDGQWLNWGHTPTRVDDDTFTVATDLTTTYHAGRRLKVTGSATGYCTIASSSYSNPNTTVNVTMDSGNLPATLSAVHVSILSATNAALPSPLPALSGANLTALNASNVSSGTLADGRLSSNVPLKDAANTFTAAQTISVAGASSNLTVANTSDGVTAFLGTGSAAGFTGTGTNHDYNFYTNNLLRGAISSAGNWTINAPDSGITLTASGAASAGTEVQRWTDGTRTAHLYISNSGSGTDVQFGSSGGLFLFSNTGTNYLVLGTGLQIGAATGGDKGAGTLNTAGAIYQNNVPVALSTGSGASGTWGIDITGNAATATSAGSATTATSASYASRSSIPLGYADGCAYHISSGITIAAADLSEGVTYTIVNNSGSAITITQGSGAFLYKAGSGTTGNCTLAKYGIATIRGIGTASGIIMGNIS